MINIEYTCLVCCVCNIQIGCATSTQAAAHCANCAYYILHIRTQCTHYAHLFWVGRLAVIMTVSRRFAWAYYAPESNQPLNIASYAAISGANGNAAPDWRFAVNDGVTQCAELFAYMGRWDLCNCWFFVQLFKYMCLISLTFCVCFLYFTDQMRKTPAGTSTIEWKTTISKTKNDSPGKKTYGVQLFFKYIFN